MKSTGIKQRYRIDFFRNVSLDCFTAELDEKTDSQSMTMLLKLYGYIRGCKRTVACFFLCFNRYFLLFSSEIILKLLFPSGSVNIVELSPRQYSLRLRRIVVKSKPEQTLYMCYPSRKKVLNPIL